MKRVLGRRKVNLVRNRYSWHKEANILYLDYLPHQGFSFSSSRDPTPASVEMVAEDLKSFLSQLMEAMPHYVPGYNQSRNKLMVWAHSFAAPLAVALVESLTSDQRGHQFNLQGLALENPLVNSSLQLGKLFMRGKVKNQNNVV